MHLNGFKNDLVKLFAFGLAILIEDKLLISTELLRKTLHLLLAASSLQSAAIAETIARTDSEAERAEANHKLAQRPQPERPQGRDGQAERAQAEHAQADHAQAERAQADHAQAERAQAERAQADRAQAERAQAERAQADRAQAERAQAERAQADRAQAERAQAERAQADRAQAERAQAEQLATQRAHQAQAQEESVIKAQQAEQKMQEQARLAQEQRASLLEQQARNAQTQALLLRKDKPGNLVPHERPFDRAGLNNPGQQTDNRRKPGDGTVVGGSHEQSPDTFNSRGSRPIGDPHVENRMRLKAPPPLQAAVVPLPKAISMPVLPAGGSPEDRQHADSINHNLQKHLIAVEASQAPASRVSIRDRVINNYFNNYQTVVNNQPITINRENTNYFRVPVHEYPHWFQPEPGWVYSNGFSVGNTIRVGLDWLRWGWHPYFGPPPDGFICSFNYVPTPWIYVPAYGLWRVPGVNAYSESGPPYDYEGPISVEVFEPRHIQTRDPFTGWMNDRVINVVYFYNAFYYPEFERYGYMNRHGYFIWLNLDDYS